ncbi:hypothetical protein [Arthrobacter sp. NPDC089319]|uniref:hypothetical protein n=1 Tax=Arthrobacter sp. NPDC089319 TaxID=3155915 RepID=UPI0034270D09
MPRTLNDWTRQPVEATNPLPSLSAKRRSGAWPIGLLSEVLAPEIALRGVRYKRGQGFTQDGEPLGEYGVAQIARTVLTIASEQLDSRESRSDSLLRAQAIAAEWMDDAQAFAHNNIDDYEAAENLADVTTFTPTMIYKRLTEQLQAPDALAQDAETAAMLAPWQEHSDALALTARDLAQSGKTRAALAKDLRSLLPAPSAAVSGEARVVSWLSQFDDVDLLLRSDVGRYYVEDGEPGKLPSGEVRALAAARWGEPRKFQGQFVYRPARANVRPASLEVVK